MSEVTKSLSDWLRDSLRSRMLFGRSDEPLDAYGLRIVRVILVELEAVEGRASDARFTPMDEGTATGSAENRSSSFGSQEPR